MRPVIKYLLLVFVVANLVGLALFLHLWSTGTTLYRYASSGAEYLDRDGSPTRHIARFIRLVVLDSGLLSNPQDIELPPFPGPKSWPAHATHTTGFRRLEVNEYGVPQQSAVGHFEPQAMDNVVRVSEEQAFEAALRNAKAGDIILLSPGVYRFDKQRIALGGNGTPERPIVVRAETIGEVRLELNTVEGFYVDRPYWLFENLEIQGVCSDDSRCEHAFHVVGDADGTTLRNNRLIDFNAPLKVNGLFGRAGDRFPDYGLVHNNAIYNTRVRLSGNPVTLLNINAGSGWVVAANFIADFAKGKGDRISYAAFMKSNSEAGVFERNLVVCHWRLPMDSGLRVGLSFGGGGSAAKFSRKRSNAIEHTGGVMRNNVIARCPSDVGIYLNKAARTRIHNNLLIGTQGIDVRFDTSSASIHDNVLDGRIRSRDGGAFEAENNLISDECSSLDEALQHCGASRWMAELLWGEHQ